MKHTTLSVLALGAAMIAFASPALAAGLPVPSPATCNLSDVTGAIDCNGFYAGNLVNNSGTNPDTMTIALNDMGYVGTPDYSAVMNLANGYKVDLASGATTASFSHFPTLVGTTFVAIHWGGQDDVTGIYKLNLLAPVSSLTFAGINPLTGRGGSSNIAVFSTGVVAVPEPASWALMIAGLGIVGAAMRRRKTAVSFA